MGLLGEWWLLIWPNLAASLITFGCGLLWAKRKFLLEMEKRELRHLERHKQTQDAIAAIARGQQDGL